MLEGTRVTHLESYTSCFMGVYMCVKLGVEKQHEKGESRNSCVTASSCLQGSCSVSGDLPAANIFDGL